MDRPNVERTVIYTLIIILSVALIAGSIALILQLTRDPDTGDGKKSTAEQTDEKTEPPTATEPPETTGKAPETGDTGAPETTAPPVTQPPVTEPSVNVTVYDTPRKMYATSNVNARESYSTTSVILGMFYKSEEVTVTGETDNGWYQVKFNNHTAYIRSDLLTDDADKTKVSITTYTAAKTMYASSNVNVRESYTTNSKSIELIPMGTEVSVTGETDNGWYQVSYNGAVAYIKSEYLSNTKPSTPVTDAAG